MKRISHSASRFLLVVFCLFALVGCKEILFSKLDEIEANEMVAILSAAGVAAERERDKDDFYSLLIDKEDVAAATTLLRNQGYPKPKFQSLGDVFTAEGIVGTPFEQQARYIYAMNQELSQTVTSISGIRSARVIVTAPPKERYERKAPPATASVTINYEPNFNVEPQVPKIKLLIAYALPNLEYDNVAVALFPASGPQIRTPRPEPRETEVIKAGFITQKPSGAGTLPGVIGVICLLLAAGIVAVRYRFWL